MYAKQKFYGNRVIIPVSIQTFALLNQNSDGGGLDAAT